MQIEKHLKSNLVNVPSLNSQFKLCEKTKVLYFINKNKKKNNYEKDYFFLDYKNQYGKDYIEDEKNLRNLAQKRLKKIEKYFIKYSKTKKFKLFEIGTALGFFLDEARLRNSTWVVEGVEVSKMASQYAQKKLKLKVRNLDFLQTNLKEKSLDAICAYYVLEHFPRQKSVFKKMSKALKKGGIFSFALPSTFGPLYHFNKKSWIATHPQDHFVDYNPKSLKNILSLYNLNLIATWPSSYHQERLPFFLKIFIPNFIYKAIARFLSYGDTFEGIAIKI